MKKGGGSFVTVDLVVIFKLLKATNFSIIIIKKYLKIIYLFPVT